MRLFIKMVLYSIKSLKNTVVNLGTKNGKMLSIPPSQEKVITHDVFMTFADRIAQYATDGFITFEKVKTVTEYDSDSKSTPKTKKEQTEKTKPVFKKYTAKE